MLIPSGDPQVLLQPSESLCDVSEVIDKGLMLESLWLTVGKHDYFWLTAAYICRTSKESKQNLP